MSNAEAVGLLAVLGLVLWAINEAHATPPHTTREGGSMGDQPAIYNRQRLTADQQLAADLIISLAERTAVNPAFMLALAVTESSLRPTIIGDDGISIGLFQLQVATAKQFQSSVTADELRQPAVNTALALQYMQRINLQWPGHTYADYAEAWTLGGHGRFDLHRRNLGKIVALRAAVRDLDLALDIEETWL